MRVRLKGLKVVRKRLADGTRRTYYYAWNGGPRIEGEPGSPEFIAAYNAAVAQKPTERAEGLLQAIFDKFRDSSDFLKLKDRTRSDYEKLLKLAGAKFGTLPQAALPGRKCRAAMLEWRDDLAKKSERQADYAWTVLARALSWAVKRGHIEHNPCAKGGRLYTATRADKVWSPSDISALAAVAPPDVRLALMLAIWTGQRQGDLIKLPWSAYDGKYIRLKQSKTGVRVVVPVGAPLRQLLDATERRAKTIMTDSDGRSWKGDGFRQRWRRSVAQTEISDLTFHDLRGTAVLFLNLAGCSVQEIATITGHTLSHTQSILDANYFHRDIALADSAIAKLEKLAIVGDLVSKSLVTD